MDPEAMLEGVGIGKGYKVVGCCTKTSNYGEWGEREPQAEAFSGKLQ
jgi:hypothetical protein